MHNARQHNARNHVKSTAPSPPHNWDPGPHTNTSTRREWVTSMSANSCTHGAQHGNHMTIKGGKAKSAWFGMTSERSTYYQGSITLSANYEKELAAVMRQNSRSHAHRSIMTMR
eukprot:scaffold45191_cov37-Tisochrysis_lutea.AAC.3